MRYSEKLLRLGSNIAYYRKYRLLTQQELAEKANMSSSFITKLENPNIFIGITFEKLCKIAKALGVTEAELLDFTRV